MALGDQAVEWKGGSLDELVAMLSGPALAARIEVLAPEPGTRAERVAGEVHMVAGGVSESFAGDLRGDEALEHLKALSSTRFRVEPCVPDPETGGVAPPGPDEGLLTERPLASLMRYCEQFAMTCLLEVWRGSEHATIRYRRGEIASSVVEGSDAPERLPEVMTWSDGRYRIVLPPLVLPAPPRAIRPATSEPRTLYGYATSEPPRAPATAGRDLLPRETLPMAPPPQAAENRSTQPGRPVDVFDTAIPDRTTDRGHPAAPRPPADGAGAARPSPDVVAATAAPPTPAPVPVPVHAPAPIAAPAPAPAAPSAAAARPAPVAVAPAPARITTPTGGAPRTTKPPTGGRTPRRVAVRRRTLSDLPVVAHVGLGLALGLAVVGAYWMVQGILTH